MAKDYLNAMQIREKHPEYKIDDITNQYSKNIKWDSTLKDRFRAGRSIVFSPSLIRKVTYRPFVAMHCYADDVLVKRPGISRHYISGVGHQKQGNLRTGCWINQAVLRPCGRYDAGFGSNFEGPVLPKIPL